MNQVPTLRGGGGLMRELNATALLNLIKERGQISRIDLAHTSGLSPAAVTVITRALIRRGLVRETGPGESRGGRRSVLLQLEPSAGYVVGLKLMEQAAALAVTDLAANVVFHEVHRVDVRGQGPTAAVEPVRAALRAARIAPERLYGVGVGLSGVIDAEAGVCRYSALLGWRDVDVRAPLEAALGHRVWVDNDVNTLAIYEQWFGAGRGQSNVLVVTVGRGVGLGIVAQGAFYRGSTGGAGEFGHTTLVPDGPECSCGKQGCLEAYVSDAAIVRAARGAGCEVEDVAAVRAAAQRGDPGARQAYDEAGRALGIGLANLVNLFDPGLIVLAGEGAVAGDLLFGPMRAALARYVFDRLGANLRIVIEPSGDESWARGAASLVLRELFRGPLREAADGWPRRRLQAVG